MMLYRRDPYLRIGKSSGKTRLILFLAALFAMAATLQACGIKVGVNDDYVSERNAPDRGREPMPVASAYSFSPGRGQLSGTGRAVVATARTQTGVPYRSGGVTPQKGFDCSGLILWTYSRHGVSVPRLAKAQAAYGQQVSFNALQPGDIVAFRIKGAYHTGIYAGDGKFIHSPKTGSHVREESIQVNYWRKNFVGGRRVL